MAMLGAWAAMAAAPSQHLLPERAPRLRLTERSIGIVAPAFAPVETTEPRAPSGNCTLDAATCGGSNDEGRRSHKAALLNIHQRSAGATVAAMA